jgi:NAD(P)-dependent dehydrogenase (short-subunit alcohol dehydrogenase family)
VRTRGAASLRRRWRAPRHRRHLVDPRAHRGPGLLGLVRSLAAELAADNVQVNAICPGWVDTDMAWQGIDLLAEAIGGTREQAYEQAMSEVPLRRMSQPEDIAGTVAWLLSADSRGVTGQAIDHNGGAYVI